MQLMRLRSFLAVEKRERKSERQVLLQRSRRRLHQPHPPVDDDLDLDLDEGLDLDLDIQPKSTPLRVSRFIGVRWHEKSSGWMASIRHQHGTEFLGLFGNEKKAARAYDSAARRVLPKGILNFPDSTHAAVVTATTQDRPKASMCRQKTRVSSANAACGGSKRRARDSGAATIPKVKSRKRGAKQDASANREQLEPERVAKAERERLEADRVAVNTPEYQRRRADEELSRHPFGVAAPWELLLTVEPGSEPLGTVFYFNRVTKDVQWDVPAEVERAQLHEARLENERELLYERERADRQAAATKEQERLAAERAEAAKAHATELDRFKAERLQCLEDIRIAKAEEARQQADRQAAATKEQERLAAERAEAAKAHATALDRFKAERLQCLEDIRIAKAEEARQHADRQAAATKEQERLAAERAEAVKAHATALDRFKAEHLQCLEDDRIAKAEEARQQADRQAEQERLTAEEAAAQALANAEAQVI